MRNYTLLSLHKIYGLKPHYFRNCFLILFVFALISCSSDKITPESTVQSTLSEDVRVLNIDGFENGLASFWHGELWTKTAGGISSEKQRVGKQSMRISWRADQMDGTNKMLHSELLTAPLPEGETERWYGYSSYFSSASMANDDQGVIISQWHGIPDDGVSYTRTGPPVCIGIQSNRLSLVYQASNVPLVRLTQAPTSRKEISLGNAIFDRWVDYVVHIKWDPTGSSGQLQMWQDGVLIVNEQNINIGYLEKNKPYWKFGLYCYTEKNKTPEKVVYYDEVRIGGPTAGYDAVKPGRSDGTAKPQLNPKN